MMGEVRFDTESTEQAIPAFRMAEVVVEGALVNVLVETWRRVW
jgi:hypothetical protein